MVQGAISVYGEGGLLELMRRGVGDKQLLEGAKSNPPISTTIRGTNGTFDLSMTEYGYCVPL